jgi:hypothetical protein
MPSEGIGNGEWLYQELERRKRVRHGLPPLTEAEQSVSRKEARRAGRAARRLALYPSETSSEESLSSSCADGWETTSQGGSDEEATDADDEVGAPARGVSAAAVSVKTQLFTDEQAQQIRGMISEAVSKAVSGKLPGQTEKGAKAGKAAVKGACRA